MTTIVADQKMGYMASDFMITTNDNDVAISCETKIDEFNIGGDQYLVGSAGLEGPGLLFLDWFKNGDWDEPPEPLYDIGDEDDFTVLVLGPEGIFVVDKWMRMLPSKNRWYGIGSGGAFAWPILEAGCGIDKAMETAIRMDPNSGFGYEIKYLDGGYDDRRA